MGMPSPETLIVENHKLANNKRTVYFGDLDRVDDAGRHFYAREITIDATIRVDTTQASMNAAYSGELLYAAIKNLRLKLLGGVNVFGDQIDGRRVRDWSYARWGALNKNADPDDVPDADDTDVDTRVKLSIPLGPSLFDARLMGPQKDRKLDSGIPLAALDHRIESDAVLSFVEGDVSDLPSNDGLAAPSNGEFFTLNNIKVSGYWSRPYKSHVPYLDEKVFPSDEKQGRIAPDRTVPSRLSLVLIRPQQGDTSRDVLSTEPLTIHHDNDLVYAAVDADELADIMEEKLATPKQDLPGDFKDQALPIKLPMPGTPISDLGSGPVRWTVGSFGNLGNLRVLYAEERALPSAAWAKWARALGVDPASPEPKRIRDVSPDLLNRKAR
ncbi:MAG: hypothetical protein ACOCUS_00035 [Polyangiales bacterium]